MRARKPRSRMPRGSVDEAFIRRLRKAARPAIVLYLHGKGARPDDASLWFTEQDRKVLRRLHANGLAREDPRYFDALIEAAQAGDPLSKTETKELALHARVMAEGFYPSAMNRASELSAEAQTLGRTVGALQPKAKAHDAIVRGGRHGGRTTGGARQGKATQWQKDIQDYYRRHPSTRPSSYRAESARLLRALTHLSVDKETLRKFLAKSQPFSTRFRSPVPPPR